MAYPTLGLTIIKLPYKPVNGVVVNGEMLLPDKPIYGDPPPPPKEEPRYIPVPKKPHILCAPGYALTAAGKCVPESMITPPGWEPSPPRMPRIIPGEPVPVPVSVNGAPAEPAIGRAVIPGLIVAVLGFLFLR